MPKTNTAGSELLPSLLCRSYLMVVVLDVSLMAIDGECRRKRVVRWGIGVLPDGEHELLGVWPHFNQLVTVWQTIANDLKARGVERIQFVVESDPASIQATLRASYPGVIAVPLVGQFPDPIDGVQPVLGEQLGSHNARAPRYRRLVRKVSDAANLLNLRLSQTLNRHGCFANLAAAESFIVDRLVRAERDLRGFGLNAFAGHAHPGSRAVGMSRSAALGV